MNALLRAAVVAAVVLPTGSAHADDIFVCATTFLEDETTDFDFRALGCTGVGAVSVGYSNVPTAGPGSPVGRFGPVTLNMVFAVNAQKFLQVAQDGTELPVPVVISWRRDVGVSGGPAYATLTMEHVRVSEVHAVYANGDAGSARVVLRASKITYSVRPINADGTLGNAVTVPWEASP